MSSPSSSSYSYNSSLLVIAILLAFAFAFTVLIHLVLRLLARLSSFSANSPTSAVSYASNADPPHHKSLVDSLPVFTLSSLPSSPTSNCSICLSQFSASDRVTFLPACLHAFHSPCIDTWLKSSPSCPLCRSAVQCDQYVEPMQQQPPPQQQQQGEAPASAEETVQGGSWLKEYVDRLVVSASSSFNSMRFLNRAGSRGLDEEGGGSLELGESFRREDHETGYFASSFKWIMAAAATNSQDSHSPW